MKGKTGDMKLEKLIAEREEKYKHPAELPVPEQEISRRLEQLFTGAISDVLREFVYLHQCLPHEIMPLREGMKVAGPAFTIKSCQNTRIIGDMENRVKMLDQLYDGAICVWDSSNASLDAALWGGVTTSIAKRNGARGAIVDGGCRDSYEVLEQDFPVFCRYRTPNGSLARNLIIGFQVPLMIGGVLINPGDFLFGDIDGVVVIPREVVYDVVVRAEDIKKNEKGYKEWIKEGMSAQEILDKGGYF